YGSRIRLCDLPCARDPLAGSEHLRYRGFAGTGYLLCSLRDIASIAMTFLDYLQKLPLSLMLVATLSLAIVAGWIIIGVVRLCVDLSSRDHGKSPYIPELVTITSILFALILSFSAAGVWNDWVQAQNAVQREALALDNVLALAEGLPADRGAKVKEQVIAY